MCLTIYSMFFQPGRGAAELAPSLLADSSGDAPLALVAAAILLESPSFPARQTAGKEPLDPGGGRECALLNSLGK